MQLNEFFIENPKTAIAFSGGVDSSYLLYCAKKYARKVQAYYVKSAFQPQFETDDAIRVAKELDVPLKILTVDVLSSKKVKNNPSDRCYYCKRLIFETIFKAASQDGFSIVLDGTNASDDINDRPGILALCELSVLSPLRICGLTKDEIRQLSKEAGLSVWDKPAYACLATRISVGETITEEKLRATEKSENLLHALGVKDFRVRLFGKAAKIQVPSDQIGKIIENRDEILKQFKEYYSDVLLDLEVRE